MKGLPEDELCGLFQSKIKSFKDVLDEASRKFHLGVMIKDVPIESDDEVNVTLTGTLLPETSIVVNPKAK